MQSSNCTQVQASLCEATKQDNVYSMQSLHCKLNFKVIKRHTRLRNAQDWMLMMD